jgi:hypothetical protein
MWQSSLLPGVHYRVYNSCPMEPILIEIDPSTSSRAIFLRYILILFSHICLNFYKPYFVCFYQYDTRWAYMLRVPLGCSSLGRRGSLLYILKGRNYESSPSLCGFVLSSLSPSSIQVFSADPFFSDSLE